jgi:hypothetical protein
MTNYDTVPTGDARLDGPTVCECPGPPTRLHLWHGDSECARCRRLIWTAPPPDPTSSNPGLLETPRRKRWVQ